MRLHRLTLQGIGPFAGQHSIDFDALGASGLFLLEGPTGSGKSTVIDAVVFALYGRPAGIDPSDDRLPSDFARSDPQPFVELTFSTSAGVYRVRRSPRHERVKRRGTGVTTINATATLMQLLSADDLKGQELGAGVADVNEQLSGVVGLDRLQFIQTVVLPQGEFAKFLQSDAETRRDLLQRLFGTEIYSRVQVQLEDRRRAAHDQLRSATDNVGRCAAVFAAAAQLDADQEQELSNHAQLAAEDDLVSSLLDGVEQRVRSTANEASASAEKSLDHLTKTQAHLDAVLQTEAAVARKRAAMRERSELLADVDRINFGRERLAAADRYDRVALVIGGLTRAEALLGEANAALAKASRELPSHVVDEEWSVLREVTKDRLSRLSDVLAIEASLDTQRNELADLRGRQQALATQRTALQEAHDEMPAHIEGLSAEHHRLSVLAAAAVDRSRHVTELRGRVAAAERVTLLERDLLAAEAKQQRRTSSARVAVEQEVELRRRRITGMAGELAAELVPGEACQVCGALDHPSPARPADSPVTAVDLDKAETKRKVVERALAECAESVAHLATELARARGESGDAQAPQLRSQLVQAEVELAASHAAVVTVVDIRDQRAAAELQQTALIAQVAELHRQVAELAVKVESVSRAYVAATEQVRLAAGEFASVSEQVAELNQQLSSLDQAISARTRQGNVAADKNLRAAELAAALREAGFAAREEATDAALDGEQRAKLQEMVASHDQAMIRAAAVLDELGTVDEAAEFDLDALRLDLEHANGLERAARAAATTAGERLRAVAEAGEAVRAAVAKREEVGRRVSAVVRIADLVAASTSDNARAMTLSTFVLLERFRDVVAAANQRLVAMSDGRYQLEHVVDKERRKRSGLGLRVIDLRTDRPRDPKTLSGGETFYCSLALALGLADVVTAESGGISLETLFVDEGFGSLDPETLDHVLDVLGKLSRGGRTVGIVSHVTELKERIVERVHVSRLPDGSSTLDVHV